MSPGHFHVILDVASCYLNLSIREFDQTYTKCEDTCSIFLYLLHVYAHFCLVFGVPVVVNDLRCVAFVDKEHFVNICRMVERSLYCDFKFMKGNVRGNA